MISMVYGPCSQLRLFFFCSSHLRVLSSHFLFLLLPPETSLTIRRRYVSRLSPPLPTTLHAFVFITRRIRRFLPSLTHIELCLLTLAIKCSGSWCLWTSPYRHLNPWLQAQQCYSRFATRPTGRPAWSNSVPGNAAVICTYSCTAVLTIYWYLVSLLSPACLPACLHNFMLSTTEYIGHSKIRQLLVLEARERRSIPRSLAAGCYLSLAPILPHERAQHFDHRSNYDDCLFSNVNHIYVLI